VNSFEATFAFGTEASTCFDCKASSMLEKTEKVEAGIIHGDVPESRLILGILQGDQFSATSSASSESTRVLIGSGSTVTAFPSSFGKEYCTVYHDSLNLISVTGDKIRNYGDRVVPCQNSSGQQVELRGVVADVKTAIASVSSMNDHGTSAWFPSKQLQHAWLLTDDGVWTELNGPSLLSPPSGSGKTSVAPCTCENGVFWMDLEPLKRGTLKKDQHTQKNEDEMLEQIQEKNDDSVHEETIVQTTQAQNETRQDDHLSEDTLEGDDLAGRPISLSWQTPDATTIAAHELGGHSVFQPWCARCVCGRGKHAPDAKSAQLSGTAVKFDYFYLSEHGEVICEQQDTQWSSYAIILVGVECFSGACMSLRVPTKGGSDEPTNRIVAAWLETLGCKSVQALTVGSYFIKDLVNNVKPLTKVEVELQWSVPFSIRKSVEGTQIHFQIAAQFRTLRKELETSINHVIEPGMAINDWLIRHCGWYRTRFRCTEADGDTPYYRLHGDSYSGQTSLVGRVVLACSTIDAQTNEFSSQWNRCIWLGKIKTDEGHVVATLDGRIAVCQSIRSLADNESYDLEFLRSIVDTPVNFRATPVVSDSMRKDAPHAAGVPHEDLDVEHPEREASSLLLFSPRSSDSGEDCRDTQSDKETAIHIPDEGSIHVMDPLTTTFSAVDSDDASVHPLAASSTPVAPSTPPAVAVTAPVGWAASDLEPAEPVSSAATTIRPAASLTPTRRPSTFSDSLSNEDMIGFNRTVILNKEVLDESEIILVRDRDMEVLGKFNANEWVVLDLQEKKWISLRWENVCAASGEFWSCWTRGMPNSVGEDTTFSPTLTVVPTQIIHLRALKAHHSLVYYDPARAVNHTVELSHIYSEESHTDVRRGQYDNSCPLEHGRWQATIEVHIDDSIIEIVSDSTENCIQLLSSFSLLKVVGQFDPWTDTLVSEPFLGRWGYYFNNDSLQDDDVIVIFQKIDLKCVKEDLCNSQIVIKELAQEINDPVEECRERLQHLVQFLYGREGEARTLTIDPSSCDSSILAVSDWSSWATTTRSTDGIVSSPFGVFIQNSTRVRTLQGLPSNSAELRDALYGHIQNLCAEASRQSVPVIKYTYPLVGPSMATGSGDGSTAHTDVGELFVRQIRAATCMAMCQTGAQTVID